MVPAMVREGKTIVLTTHYMSEADELSAKIAIIEKGALVAEGRPTDIKRKFSEITVCEVILKENHAKAMETLSALPGIKRVASTSDGPIQKLTIHAIPGTEIRDGHQSTRG